MPSQSQSQSQSQEPGASSEAKEAKPASNENFDDEPGSAWSKIDELRGDTSASTVMTPNKRAPSEFRISTSELAALSGGIPEALPFAPFAPFLTQWTRIGGDAKELPPTTVVVRPLSKMSVATILHEVH